MTGGKLGSTSDTASLSGQQQAARRRQRLVYCIAVKNAHKPPIGIDDKNGRVVDEAAEPVLHCNNLGSSQQVLRVMS